MSYWDCHVPDKGKFPLYGPLNITDYAAFLTQAKSSFDKSFSSNFRYQLKVDNFEPLYQIGEGGFGKVLLVKYKLFSSCYAMKVLNKLELVKNKSVRRALNEKLILQSVNFPLCVHLIYFSQDNSNLYFVLPFITGGDLFAYLNTAVKFQNNLSKFYAAQVILALEYLHVCRVVYRDLKPENILIDQYGYVKITDFGLAKIVQTRTYTFCGTPDYIAPEIILGLGYGKSVDWWALGVLIFEMVSGRPPFFTPNQLGKYKKICSTDYVMPKAFEEDLKDLIRSLLQTDVTRRAGNMQLGAEEVKGHNWFKGVDWMSLLNRKVAPPHVPTPAGTISKLNFPVIKKSQLYNASEEDVYYEYFDRF